MAKEEVALQNFVGGELSRKMFGRFDLQIFRNGLRRLKNFIAQTVGEATHREGFCFVNHTRLNQIANLLPFEFNDEQAYTLEFTDRKLRFFRNENFITEDTNTITNITQADPGVVTAGTHGYANGDEIFITGVAGMTEVNGKTFLAAGVTGTTFELTDIDGNNVDTSGFTAYSSGGTAARIYEIDTPYDEDNDLFKLKIDQNADVMYITHPLYEPRKLTRTDHDDWDLDLFTRTADPFTDQQTISGITQADPAVVTVTGHTFSDGDTIIIETVAGMTEINGQPYKVANSGVNTFELTDLNDVNIDSTGFSAYSSAGYASDADLLPSAVAFYESRLWYAGTPETPDKIFGSRSPDSSGDSRYDDFTTGTDADHAVIYALGESKINKILWLVGTDRQLLVGSFGSLIKVTGTETDQAITPTSISVRSIDRIGVEDVSPINKQNIVSYLQRGGFTLNTLQFEALEDRFTPVKRTLLSDQISEGGFKQLAWQTGIPDILWAGRNDGILGTLTFEAREGVFAWARQTTGVANVDKFLSVSTIPRPLKEEQVWVVAQRKVGSNTRRFVEFKADPVIFPERVDFFTGVANEAADDATYRRAVLEKQKEAKHIDSMLTYDGSTIGADAVAAVTPGATTGTSITFTSDAAVFVSTDVGREIWKKAINGEGTGRATITSFTSSTSVDCDITVDFDDADAMAAGDWYLTTNSLSGFDHLEGESIRIIADGGKHPDETVSSGAVTLDYQVSVAHGGVAYEGFLQPMSIELGGATGPSQTKLKHIHELRVRFRNTLGASVGSDLYSPELVKFTEVPVPVGSPQPVFSGVKAVPFQNSWDKDQVIYVRQDNSLPCNVQLISVFGETDDQ